MYLCVYPCSYLSRSLSQTHTYQRSFFSLCTFDDEEENQQWQDHFLLYICKKNFYVTISVFVFLSSACIYIKSKYLGRVRFFFFAFSTRPSVFFRALLLYVQYRFFSYPSMYVCVCAACVFCLLGKTNVEER